MHLELDDSIQYRFLIPIPCQRIQSCQSHFLYRNPHSLTISARLEVVLSLLSNNFVIVAKTSNKITIGFRETKRTLLQNDSLISDIRTTTGNRFAPPAGTRPGATWPATSWASTATTRPITRKNRFKPEKNRNKPVFSVLTRQFCRKRFCLCSRPPPTSRRTRATLRST